MSTDLKYLAFTAILTASLWIPYVVCQVITNGALKPPNYVDPTPRPLPLWGRRADRTYINAVETFAPFAALVIAIHLAGKADATTAFWTNGLFLAAARPCRGVPACHPICADAALHARLCGGHRVVRGTDQVVPFQRLHAKFLLWANLRLPANHSHPCTCIFREDG
jgi:uncharacterized MAPEG superfamily protein